MFATLGIPEQDREKNIPLEKKEERTPVQDATRATHACSSSVAMLRPQSFPSQKSQKENIWVLAPRSKRYNACAKAVWCVVMMWSGEGSSKDQLSKWLDGRAEWWFEPEEEVKVLVEGVSISALCCRRRRRRRRRHLATTLARSRSTKISASSTSADAMPLEPMAMPSGSLPW